MSNIRYGTYYKGGAGDSFMSGVWIGADLIEDTVFISCQFNGVEAVFSDCVFIDCDNAPDGEGVEGCSYYGFPAHIRLVVQHKDNEGNWR